jgi:hypothetical protein
MNHPEHGWQNPGAAQAGDTGGNAAAPQEAMGAASGAGPVPGNGHGFHGAWPYPNGSSWPGASPWPGYPPPGFVMAPPPYGYGPYGAAAYLGPGAGPGQPWAAAHGGAAPGPEAQGFGAAMGNIADQAGLGMLKDFFSFGDGDFWKGALVGAAVMLLLTNENLRDALAGGAAKTAAAVKSGFAAQGGEESAAGDDASVETEPDQEESSR